MFPYAKAVITENDLFTSEVRDLLYRRTPDSRYYRVLYRILDETPDGPQVILMGVRLAERPPITLNEAREIETQQ